MFSFIIATCTLHYRFEATRSVCSNLSLPYSSIKVPPLWKYISSWTESKTSICFKTNIIYHVPVWSDVWCLAAVSCTNFNYTYTKTFMTCSLSKYNVHSNVTVSALYVSTWGRLLQRDGIPLWAVIYHQLTVANCKLQACDGIRKQSEFTSFVMPWRMLPNIG